nr:murinoglobulin-2-like [Cherax quadricarinatus]
MEGGGKRLEAAGNNHSLTGVHPGRTTLPVAMLASNSLFVCVLTLTAAVSHGGYIITTPRQWVSGAPAQVCVYVDNPSAPEGKLTFAVTAYDWQQVDADRNVTVVPNTSILIPGGKTEKCYEVAVPSSTYYYGHLHIFGSVAGVNISRTVSISLKSSNQVTFIQTDKYLYEPGENVKFRILTVTGPYLNVSTDQYPLVWIETPSRTRIAQWKTVDNTAGLVHLDFDLADEPEKGLYTIYVDTQEESHSTTNFKVEDFVLPRFEVTLKPPSYILATDESFTFTVCANYTFGQPVKGNLSLTVINNQRKKCEVRVTHNVTFSGCREVKLTAQEMKVIGCNVYSLQASVIVTEEGTDVEMKREASVSITRNAVSFKTIYEDEYMKPNLPYTLKVRAELPDGSVAAGVPVEVCAAGRCNNMTTAPDGLFTIVLPDYTASRVIILALNCRANMQQSEFSKDLDHYYSPSNSSLLIHAPEGKLKCVSGEAQEYILPVLFSATGQTSATFIVQVVSRGKIQHQSSQEYELSSGELPISKEHLVDPLPPPPENTIRGVVNIKVTLPPTASPKIKVLVWYTREDGEVVADTRELEVEKCLPNKVDLTWSVAKAQPGAAASLTLSSEPHSVCSLGVVDRSTELLAVNPDPISLEDIFNIAESFDVSRWQNSQVNNYQYCENKKLSEIAKVAERIIYFDRRYSYYRLRRRLQMFIKYFGNIS